MNTTPNSLEEALHLLQRQQDEMDRLHAAYEAWMRAVAHDLRAPLRHVVSFAPLLRESVEELAAAAPQAVDAAADAREFAATMEQAGRKMTAMLDGMALVSRASRVALKKGAVDWAALVQQLVQALQTRHPAVQWQLSLPFVAWVQADLEWLREVTQALLDNALKFSVGKMPAVIQLDMQTLSEGVWRLSVRDNGVGFDDSRATTLGGLFQRMHSEKAFEGVGCGLALVSTVAQRHGARWHIHSRPEQGCTVSVDWPRASAD